MDSVEFFKTYNNVVHAFEYVWYEPWCRFVEIAEAGLQVPLIIRHPDNSRLCMCHHGSLYSVEATACAKHE